MTATIELTQVQCGACHVMFAIPHSMLTKKQQTGDSFSCPNGCSISYKRGENERLRERAAKLESELNAARTREQLERDQKHAAELALAEESHRLARLKKRVSAGTCPCCKRTVSQLARHIKMKHPTFGK